jgi:four helix bundle protein
MAKWKTFTELPVWKDARSLDFRIYLLSNDPPLDSDYPLRNQMLRASGSIMDNIAEGFERDGNKEFRQFLSIAKGSCGELKSQLFRCLDREYYSEEIHRDILERIEEIERQIGGLIKHLKNADLSGRKFK